MEVDIHLLELRYAHTRIEDGRALAGMRNSISRYGQIVPALAVCENNKFILIDGYLRLQALKACGHDCIKLQVVEEKEADALFVLLSRNNGRHWEVIEQAILLQELHRRFACSFGEIGRRLGRDKAFVKRRVDLVENLPDEILQAVLSGKISTWSASRVLAPLARANAEDARRLTGKLLAEPLSTRQLASFYEHYKKSNRVVRERMLENPSLFMKAKQEQEEQKEARKISDGPEGKWFRNLNIICHMLRRSTKDVRTILHPKLDKDPLLWAKQVEKLAADLAREIERRKHGNPLPERSNSGDAGSRRQVA